MGTVSRKKAAKTSLVYQSQPIFAPQLFGLIFHFYVIFLLIRIGQLDDDVKKSAQLNISINLAQIYSQRAPLNLNVNYVTVMKYTCTYQISYKTRTIKELL